MAENDSSQEKTEEATPRRREQAREKGQVPRSKELGTAAVLVAAAASMLMLGSQIGEALLQLAQQQFTLTRAQVFDIGQWSKLYGAILEHLLVPVLGFVLVLFIAGFLGNIGLGGLSFSWSAAAPKANKMSPLKGLKRMLGVQALVELVKSVAKFLVVAVVAYLLLRFNFDKILALSSGAPAGAVRNALELLLALFVLLCCSLLLVVVIDAPYQLWNHNKQLRMTKQEVKDEYKQTEGKPEVKSKIRQLQREMAQRRMMAEVPKADVVVVNPTHYSVALKYDKSVNTSPLVVAKGSDEIALKIREIAREHEVPVISSPALARAIYQSTKLDKPIPEGLFTAVAQILAYVFQLKQFQTGRGRKPIPLPSDLPIPAELWVEEPEIDDESQ
ncbi:flagellar biosynthesis protein FlhB [Ferrimonas marina]|uniref:Flagellar biosynthetic protein FlhB n=1 Tax=Ferrimonas marina TaxID=299255 RepID=A0A1M5YES1_9GAMM|nr:flagellar biosynthesis protein FlhB [Ferrimonas marina]SHI10404.1 flagellar biosynthetic protein FlhB [Ferrimonas marina]